MAGTIEGGRKAAQRNREKYGKDYYSNIGRLGGKNGTTGGFASYRVGSDGLTGRQRAKAVAAIGGRAGRKSRTKEII